MPKIDPDGFIRIGPCDEKLEAKITKEPTHRERVEAAISVYGKGAANSGINFLVPLMWPRREFKPYEADNIAFNVVRGVLLQLLSCMPPHRLHLVVQEAIEDLTLE